MFTVVFQQSRSSDMKSWYWTEMKKKKKALAYHKPYEFYRVWHRRCLIISRFFIPECDCGSCFNKPDYWTVDWNLPVITLDRITSETQKEQINTAEYRSVYHHLNYLSDSQGEIMLSSSLARTLSHAGILDKRQEVKHNIVLATYTTKLNMCNFTSWISNVKENLNQSDPCAQMPPKMHST